jgi:hypothetical protein
LTELASTSEDAKTGSKVRDRVFLYKYKLIVHQIMLLVAEIIRQIIQDLRKDAHDMSKGNSIE